MPDYCRTLWWNWSTKLCPDELRSQNVCGPAGLKDDELIYVVVLSGNFS